jgi:hypothetical protein
MMNSHASNEDIYKSLNSTKAECNSARLLLEVRDWLKKQKQALLIPRDIKNDSD